MLALELLIHRGEILRHYDRFYLFIYLFFFFFSFRRKSRLR